MRALCVTLPGLPPTVNHAYLHTAGGGKHRTAAAQAWATGATLAIRAAAAGTDWPPRVPLRVDLHLVAPDCWRWDADNRVKATLDALAQALGLDDRYVTELYVTKAHAPAAATTITLAAADPA